MSLTAEEVRKVARLARLWGTHHRLPVTAAYAASAPPATGEAVRAFRAEGSGYPPLGPVLQRLREINPAYTVEVRDDIIRAYVPSPS